MAPRKKKLSTIDLIIGLIALFLLIATLLKFDAVSNVIDPEKKLGLQNIANDAFPILLGSLLMILGIATIASIWVSIAFIAVGLFLVGQRIYQIWNRSSTPTITQN